MLYIVVAIILFIFVFTRGQRRQKKREILEQRRLLEEETRLVEQQTLLLKEKQKLLEASENVKNLEDSNAGRQNSQVQDVDKCVIKETVFENPTEDDIKGLTEDPKASIEKKKD